MHDALHVRSCVIDPAVKTVGGVRHSVSSQHVEISVDDEQVACGDLVEPQTQPLGVVRPGLLSAGGDLSRQARIVPGVKEHATGQRNFLPGGQSRIPDVGGQTVLRTPHQFALGSRKRVGKGGCHVTLLDRDLMTL